MLAYSIHKELDIKTRSETLVIQRLAKECPVSSQSPTGYPKVPAVKLSFTQK